MGRPAGPDRAQEPHRRGQPWRLSLAAHRRPLVRGHPPRAHRAGGHRRTAHRTWSATVASTGRIFGQQLIGEGRDDALPTEIRVFCFYGEVGVVNVRRAHEPRRQRRHEDSPIPPRRESRAPPSAWHDDDIELPDVFHTAVDVGRRLSMHVPRAFVRVDLLDDDGDVVFGELTPRPGGPHYFGPEDDRRLGELWERAQARRPQRRDRRIGLFAQVRSGPARAAHR